MRRKEPKDLPIDQLLEFAGETLTKLKASGAKPVIYFKFTCRHCGSRQTFDTPFVMYESGTCEACGRTTEDIRSGGFLLLSAQDDLYGSQTN